MPTPNQNAFDRISASTKYVEGMRKQVPRAVAREGERGPEILLAKLTATLASGGTANAHPFVWKDSVDAYAADTTVIITVRDTLTKVIGVSGDVVICRVLYASSAPVWEALFNSPSNTSTLMRATLTVNMATSTSPVSVSGAVSADGKVAPTTLPTTGILNYGFAARSGGIVYISGSNDTHWEVISVATFKTVSVVTDENAADPLLQNKHQTLTVMDDGNDPDAGWTTYHTGTDC